MRWVANVTQRVVVLGVSLDLELTVPGQPPRKAAPAHTYFPSWESSPGMHASGAEGAREPRGHRLPWQACPSCGPRHDPAQGVRRPGLRTLT